VELRVEVDDVLPSPRAASPAPRALKPDDEREETPRGSQAARGIARTEGIET